MSLKDRLEAKDPRLLIPLAIIALILLFLILPGQNISSSGEYCGNGNCADEESAYSCPQDCSTDSQNLRDVRVEILDEVVSIIKISVESSEWALLKTEVGLIDELLVENVKEDEVLAIVRNPINAAYVDSGSFKLLDQLNIIPVRLPSDFFNDGILDLSNGLPLYEVPGDPPLSVNVYDSNGALLAELNLEDLDQFETNESEVLIKVVDKDGNLLASNLIAPEDLDDTVIVFPVLSPGETPSPQTPETPDTPETPPEDPETPSVFNCRGKTGDLDGNDIINTLDLQLLSSIMNSIYDVGFSSRVANNLACADINNDGYLTEHDDECLRNFLDKKISSFSSCSECILDNTVEICNDAMDNDCDGQTDKDTYDETSQSYHGTKSNPVDYCVCSISTPCDQIYAINSFSDYTNEEEIKRCSSISGGQYSWRLKDDWKCRPAKADQNLACGGQSYSCNNIYDWWAWRRANDERYLNYICFGKDVSSSSACQSIEGFACGHTNCETDSPGYFQELRGYSSSVGDYWGACPLPDGEESSYCQCRCNYDKLYCGDSSNEIEPQSCWAPSGDSMCAGAEDYEYCSQ